MKGLEAQIAALTRQVKRNADDIAEVKGKLEESVALWKAAAYFAHFLRRHRDRLPHKLLEAIDEAWEEGYLTDEPRRDLLLTDRVVLEKILESPSLTPSKSFVGWKRGGCEASPSKRSPPLSGPSALGPGHRDNRMGRDLL